jgi:hypothetical protein
VRRGDRAATLPRIEPKVGIDGVITQEGHPGHKLLPVYGEMLIQVMREYSGLGDARTLRMAEIRYLYGGLRGELAELTKGGAR